jgi:hypothetical protein
MKNILFLLVALLLAGLAPVSAGVADAVLEWDIDTTLCATGNFDTLKAANDSSTICAARQFSQGYEYYLTVSRLLGTSKDTSNLCVAVDGYTFGDSLVGRARSDTSVDRSESFTFTLPIYKGDIACGAFFVADKYRLKIMNVSTGTTAASTILNGMIIRRCRPVLMNRNVGK